VKMIEQHYGHLKPAMKADKIAGKRWVAKEEVKQEENEEMGNLKQL